MHRALSERVNANLVRAACLALASGVGCVGQIEDPTGSAGSGGVGPGNGFPDSKAAAKACEEHDCSNTIDAVLVPMLAASGLEIIEEDNAVLCRRLAIDLTGLAPSAAEIVENCAGHDAKQIAEYFMNKPTNVAACDGSPPYVFVNRRHWSVPFAYDAGTVEHTFYAYIRELDQLVGDLYSGT